MPSFKPKSFRLRAQITGFGTKKQKVRLMSSQAIKVNGKKVPLGKQTASGGTSAKGKNALLKKAEGK